MRTRQRAMTAWWICLFVVLGVTGTLRASTFTFQRGDIVASEGFGTYNVFDPTGKLLTTLDTTTGSIDDTGGAFSPTGNLFVTNQTVNSVSEFDRHGNLITARFGSGFDNSAPSSIAIDSAGDVLVGLAVRTGQVLEFSPSGTLLNTFQPANQFGVDDIDLASDGKTLYYISSGSVLRYDLGTKTQLPAFADNLEAQAVRVLSNGDVLVTHGGDVLLLDSSGDVVKTYTINHPEAQYLFTLDVVPGGKSFVTASFKYGEVFEVNIATGALEQAFSTNSAELGGLIVAPEIAPPPSGVPEPAAVGMTGLGLIGFWIRRRRKRRSLSSRP